MRKQPGFGQTIVIGFQRNRFLQNMARCTKQPPQIIAAQSGRFRGRVHACPEKDFICVKVADPGDQLLVQQDRFDSAAVLSNNGFELRETNCERVRAKAACLQKLIHILDQFDLAEFPLIVERQPAVTREMKNHSRSFGRYLVVFEVLKRAGHAEVQSQPELITGAHEQMFAVSETIFEAALFESTC